MKKIMMALMVAAGILSFSVIACDDQGTTKDTDKTAAAAAEKVCPACGKTAAECKCTAEQKAEAKKKAEADKKAAEEKKAKEKKTEE